VLLGHIVRLSKKRILLAFIPKDNRGDQGEERESFRDILKTCSREVCPEGGPWLVMAEAFLVKWVSNEFYREEDALYVGLPPPHRGE